MMKSDTIPFIFACIGSLICVAGLVGSVANGGMYAAIGFLVCFGGVVGMAMWADRHNEERQREMRNIRVGAPHNRVSRRASLANDLRDQSDAKSQDVDG